MGTGALLLGRSRSASAPFPRRRATSRPKRSPAARRAPPALCSQRAVAPSSTLAAAIESSERAGGAPPSPRDSEPVSGASPGALRRLLRVGLYVAPLVIATAVRFPVCPQALLSGTPCPGCGMTRALLALLSGDLATAHAHNPIAIVVWPITIPLVGYHAVRYVATGDARLSAPWTRRIGLTLCAALAVVWIARWFGLFGGPVSVR